MRAGLARLALLTVVLVGSYLLLWPVDVDPVAWVAPEPPPPAEGPVFVPPSEAGRIGGMPGPESVAFDGRGRLHTGTARGDIVRVLPGAGRVDTLARTGGRPLGLAFAPDGRLFVADGERGLLVVSPGGEVRRVAVPGPDPGGGAAGPPARGAKPHGGPRVLRANGVAVAPDGTVYFTEPSSRHPMDRSRDDVLEARGNGRLLAHHPERGTRVVRAGLHFPNGVAVSPGGDLVAVVETSRYRVLGIPIGPGAGKGVRVLAEGLPGFPDGISVDGEGTYWVALVAPRSRLYDALLPHPFLRRALARLPSALLPRPGGGPRVLALDAEGRTLAEVRGPPADPPATSAVRRGDRLHLGSLEGRGVGTWPVPRRVPAGRRASGGGRGPPGSADPLRPLASPEAWRRAGAYLDVPVGGPAGPNAPMFHRLEGQGPTLLLLHGFPDGSWSWRRVWSGLAERFRVVAPDLLGFGFSAKPPGADYSVLRQADRVEALLDSLGVGRVHLLAHAYGVSVAQELLARAGVDAGGGPAVASACFLNGGVFPEANRPLPAQRLLRTRAGRWLARVLPYPYGAFRRNLLRTYGPRRTPSEKELETSFHLLTRAGGRRAVPALMGYLEERERHRERWVDGLRRAHGEGIPLALVLGPSDPISGGQGAAWRRHLRGAELVTLRGGIGHHPQLEAPGPTLRACAAVFARAAARSGRAPPTGGGPGRSGP